jgi:hypothetical protein
VVSHYKKVINKRKAVLENTEIQKIKKVYDEKMVHLDNTLSQKVKQHKEKNLKLKNTITQLIKQKEDLEKKIKKPNTNIISSAPSSPILKKPSLLSFKNTDKHKPITAKEALTLKTLFFIKFNQI